MCKFRVGDKVIIRKPKNTKSWPCWIKIMDEYDGKLAVVDEIRKSGMGISSVYVQFDGDFVSWQFSANWLVPATEFGRALYE